MKKILKSLKIWLPATMATMLTMLLFYFVKDYPCLRGAGLALADFEAFILMLLIALPCFVWAVSRLLRYPLTGQSTWEEKWITRLAIVTITGVLLYGAFGIPEIFSFAGHPLRFICR